MTTMIDQVRRVRRLMYGGFRYQRNRLAASISSTTDQVPLEYPQPGLGRGSILNIGLEKMWVAEWNPTTNTATVERGVEGSTPALHGYEGQLTYEVEINPRFAGWDIMMAVVDAIRALPDTLYPLRTDSEVSVEVGQTVVNLPDNMPLPANLVGVRERRSYTGSHDNQDRTFDMVPLFRGSTLVRDMTDAYGNNGAVRLGRPAPQAGFLIFSYTYAFVIPDIDEISELHDLVSQVGLASTMLDLPALGAAVMLTQALEVERSDTTSQGEPRRAEEVPPMYATQMAEALSRRLQARIREESAKLTARRGIKS